MDLYTCLSSIDLFSNSAYLGVLLVMLAFIGAAFFKTVAIFVVSVLVSVVLFMLYFIESSGSVDILPFLILSSVTCFSCVLILLARVGFKRA